MGSITDTILNVAMTRAEATDNVSSGASQWSDLRPVQNFSLALQNKNTKFLENADKWENLKLGHKNWEKIRGKN